MRVLHTIDSIGIYGAETVLLNLAVEQQRRGCSPIVFSIGSKNNTAKPIETAATRLGLHCIHHSMRDGLNLCGARKILTIAGREHIDVIHSHGYKTNILLGALPKSMRNCPIVTTLHGWTAQSQFSRLGLYRFLDRRILRRLDAVVVVNEQLKNAPYIAALDARKVRWIPNGITLDSAPATPHSNLSDDPLARRILQLKGATGVLIGAVGRLSPEKNFEALIAALPPATAGGPLLGAVILGDGPQTALLSKAIASRNLGARVLLGGYTADARRYLGLFDLLAIPSLTEGLPMILLEGMAVGLPVIATRVGDIPATLGGCGVLVEPGDVSALASAIQLMVSQLPLYRQKATSAAERIRREYSAVTMAVRYEEFYQQARANQSGCE